MNARVERILDLGELAGRKNDPTFRLIVRRLLLRPDQRLEEALIRKLILQAGDKVVDPPPFGPISEDDMVVPASEGLPVVEWGRTAAIERGQLVPGAAFRFPLTSGHYAFLGKTRSGKSCGVASLVNGLPADTKCWVLDPENDPVWADLALDRGFLVIDWTDFKRNLLEPPPNCTPDTWLAHGVRRNLRESLYLRDGSIAMLSSLFDECLREQGLFSIRHVYDKLVAHRFRFIKGGREAGWWETLKNRLEGLLVSPTFDCLRGFDLARLAERNVLFTFKGMGADDYGLALNDLLSWLSCHFEPSLNPVPRLVLVVEELHRLTNFQRLRRADISEPVVLDAARTLAKRRVSLIVVDQVVSELPVQLLANTSFRAVFGTIEGRDLDALQRSLSLTHEQRAFISHLPQKGCILQYNNPAFPNPFPVLVDELQLRQRTDEEIARRRTETLANLSYVPIQKAASDNSARATQRAESVRTARTERRVPQQERESTPAASQHGRSLSKAALDYLVEVSKDQFVPASWRDKHLHIPISQGNALRRELERAGLIALESVNTRSRAKVVVNTRITEAGYELLDSLKVAYERPRGKGGWEHRYHQHAIAKWASRNGFHRVLVEHSVGGKSVDVALVGDKRVAVEILVAGVRKEMANVRDLDSGYDEIWFCTADAKQAERLKQLVVETFGIEAQAVLDRVRFKLLREFQERCSNGNGNDVRAPLFD